MKAMFKVFKGTSNNYQLIHLKMKLEKNSEIFKSISYRYKFLVGARDPNMRECFYKKRVVTVFW